MGVSQSRLPDATFESLSLPLFDQLYNFAHWLTQDRAEAEDLVQETYAKALRGFSSFQQGTNFRAWIFRILRNAFLSSKSGLKTTVPLEEDNAPVSAHDLSTPETLLMAQVDRDSVRAALTELPVHWREVLLLCEVEEMSYQEIAEALGIPIGTVMSRLYRARQGLRSLLQEKVQGVRHGM